MNSPLFHFAVYPSQLDAFKTKAELLSTSISDECSIKKLSAFKRNDYLAMALGYKGHPDLVESAKFRVESDQYKPLIIFSNESLRQSIAYVFADKVAGISVKQILIICQKLKKKETGMLVINDLRDIVGKSSTDEHKAIMSNMNPRIRLKLKEADQDNDDHLLNLVSRHNTGAIEINLEQTLVAPVLLKTSLADLILSVESCWPKGATCATQECDGEILFWSAPIDEVTSARKQASVDEGLMPLIGLGQQVHANYYEINEQSYVAFDWNTTVVTQNQVKFN